MTLRWAHDFAIGGDRQSYLDSGWLFTHTTQNDPGFSGAPLPHHPLAGFGGMTHGLSMLSPNSNTVQTGLPLFPGAVLSDGILQMHCHFGGTTTQTYTVVRLQSGQGGGATK